MRNKIKTFSFFIKLEVKYSDYIRSITMYPYDWQFLKWCHIEWDILIVSCKNKISEEITFIILISYRYKFFFEIYVYKSLSNSKYQSTKLLFRFMFEVSMKKLRAKMDPFGFYLISIWNETREFEKTSSYILKWWKFFQRN